MIDFLVLGVSLLVLAGCVWYVRRLLRRTEEQSFVRGWDACMLAAHARRPRPGEQQSPEP